MTKQTILGISALYHDSAAALIMDGEIIAAAQEERFTRIKHDASFPHHAIEFCLNTAQIELDKLDAIVFYDKPLLKFERLLETYLAHSPRGFRSFARAMPIWLKEKLYFKQLLRRECRALVHRRRAQANNTTIEVQIALDKTPVIPVLGFSEHHLSHAASAFYPAPFHRAAVLCLDGVGEWATSSAWIGEKADGTHGALTKHTLTPLWELHFPHSLGLLYSAFTYYCGFKVNAGEYKLMGLAPYGKPVYVEFIYRHLIDVKEDGSFSLNMHYFDYPAGDVMVTQAFCELFEGAALAHDAPVTQKQKDLAASIQVVIEEVVLKIAQHIHTATGCDYLCLAGGVALNCVANGRLLQDGPFKDIWIQPAAGDAGGALGAALEYAYQLGEQSTDKSNTLLPLPAPDMQHAYLGPEYTLEQALEACSQWDVAYTHLPHDVIFAYTAQLAADGYVIGWFQGRMEFGPRALGHRSIIGDPRSTTMQSVMNLKIKQRESFRPFAPAVLQEHADQWFAIDKPSPYMLLVADVIGAEPIPAVTHVDNSARVQTVAPEQVYFYPLIHAFYDITGVPILINTSFNVRGEPPVCSPSDAIRCFLATDMDYLVIGDLVLNKADMPVTSVTKAKEVTFAKD